MTDKLTLKLTEALYSAWSAIRKQHPEIPDAVIVVGAGSDKSGLKFGHFATSRWIHKTTQQRYGEIFIGGEGLARGGRATIGTLIHESAHALADLRGVKDTSRQGRYHNTKFRSLAEELGIDVAQDATIGWSVTTVPDATASVYARQIAALDKAIVATRASDYMPRGRGGEDETPKNTNGFSLHCDCDPPRKIRISRVCREAGAITCQVCESEFNE